MSDVAVLYLVGIVVGIAMLIRWFGMTNNIATMTTRLQNIEKMLENRNDPAHD